MSTEETLTLTADAVSTVTLTGPANSTIQYVDHRGVTRDKVIRSFRRGVRVVSLNGTAPVWFTLNGVDPEATGDADVADTTGAVGWKGRWIDEEVTVKIISTGATQVRVDFADSQPTTETVVVEGGGGGGGAEEAPYPGWENLLDSDDMTTGDNWGTPRGTWAFGPEGATNSGDDDPGLLVLDTDLIDYQLRAIEVTFDNVTGNLYRRRIGVGICTYNGGVSLHATNNVYFQIDFFRKELCVERIGQSEDFIPVAGISDDGPHTLLVVERVPRKVFEIYVDGTLAYTFNYSSPILNEGGLCLATTRGNAEFTAVSVWGSGNEYGLPPS